MLAGVKHEPEDCKEEKRAAVTGYIDYREKCLRDKYVNIMAEVEQTPQGNRAKYMNWNHFFSTLFPDAPEGKVELSSYYTKMMTLYKECTAV